MINRDILISVKLCRKGTFRFWKVSIFYTERR
uniref:Uncharacterized protein n=1 Tax=Siphoviridae sp. ct9Dg3 TaxID=2827792 RepID=A0A8S5TL61_9CAUD|nr:MAG TPA: hypothetical protein [Siphoviridae sp. ct9Dg3]